MNLPQPTAVDSRSSKTLICVRWDDVLFPVHDLCERLGHEITGGMAAVKVSSPQLHHALSAWRLTLAELLMSAVHFSDLFMITTHREYPWVYDCLATFAPELLELLWMLEKKGSLQVVYSSQLLEEKLRHEGRQDWAAPQAQVDVSLKDEALPSTIGSRLRAMAGFSLLMCRRRKRQEECKTAQKLEDLDDWRTASALWSFRRALWQYSRRLPGHCYRHVIVLGGKEEAAALQRLSQCPGLQGARFFSKVIIMPPSPRVSELALRLVFDATLLPALQLLDRRVTIDLHSPHSCEANIMTMLAEALGLPKLAGVDFPGHAWGLPGPAPSARKVAAMVDEVRWLLTESLLCGPPRWRKP